MQQASINTFFRNRKRPASKFIPSPGKLITKKVLALDGGSSSPVRSPVGRYVHAELDLDLQVQKSLEPVNETYPNKETENAVSTRHSSVVEKKLPEKSILTEFKKSIRNSKKYPVLKAALKKYNAAVSQLQMKLYVPSSQCSTISTVDNSCTPRRKVSDDGIPATDPCFARFKYLLAVSPDVLVLPSQYATLEDLFNDVETVVWTLLNNKEEIVTFKLIQNYVQKLTRKKITEQHLGMIKSVYPDAYELRYELVKLPFSKVKTWEMIIERPHSNITSIHERKEKFRELLMERTKLHHQEFLKTLDPPLVIPMDQIKRWHPLFDLNSVPQVSPAPVLRILCNNDESENTEEMVVSEEQTKSSINLVRSLQKALNCVPKSLLKTIRANEVTKVVG